MASNSDEFRRRADRGRLHTVAKLLTSRGLLQALCREGYNLRQLRSVERELRRVIQPEGPLGAFVFDRFWANALRLILAARLEEKLLIQERDVSGETPEIAERYQQFLPELSAGADQQQQPGQKDASGSDTDLLHQLCLVTRYDRAAAREMYRALSMLLLLRDGQDDSAVKDWAGAMGGTKKIKLTGDN